MKKQMGCLLLLGTLLCMDISARAQGITVAVNGEKVVFTGNPPQQLSGRVMVPVRGVMEKLGATIGWNAKTSTVVASTPTMDIQLTIGNKNATVNGKTVVLDVPASIIGGSTMVPLRFIGEALGAKVLWNGTTRQVDILTSGASTTSPTPKPNPVPKAQPTRELSVTRLDHNGNGWLRAGATLKVKLDGTAGADAYFRIPGVVSDTPMRETRKGHYEGEWRLPRAGESALYISDGSVIAYLKMGSSQSPLLQSGKAVQVDTSAPSVVDRAPEPYSVETNPRPTIYALFDKSGSGMDTSRVRLSVNGRDVTADSTITRNFISYTPRADMSAGTYNVDLTLTDKAGNVSDALWQFDLRITEAEGIKSVSHNATKSLVIGDSVKVEARATPGGRMAFRIGKNITQNMKETSSGVYQGTYKVRSGDDYSNTPLRVTFTSSTGQKFSRNASRTLTLAAGALIAPRIQAPSSGAVVSNPVSIQGTTTPWVKVHIKVTYEQRTLGILLRGTSADVNVYADGNGQFKTSALDLKDIFSSSDTTYQITATSISYDGQESSATRLNFKIR